MIVALYFRDRIFTDPARYIVRVERVEVHHVVHAVLSDKYFWSILLQFVLPVAQ